MEEAPLPDDGVLSGLAPQPSAMGPSPPKPPKYGGDRFMPPALVEHYMIYWTVCSVHYLYDGSERFATNETCAIPEGRDGGDGHVGFV